MDNFDDLPPPQDMTTNNLRLAKNNAGLAQNNRNATNASAPCALSHHFLKFAAPFYGRGEDDGVCEFDDDLVKPGDCVRNQKTTLEVAKMSTVSSLGHYHVVSSSCAKEFSRI